MARCLPDIESDMSAIHRITDIYSMDGPRFFKLAWRLAAYQGCMRDNALTAAAREPQPEARQAAASPQPAAGSPPATRAVIGANPAFAGVFSFGNGGA